MSSDWSKVSELSSLDWRLERVTSWNVGAGAGAASPKQLSQQTAGVIFCATGAVSISIAGQQIAASPVDDALTIGATCTPMIGLELEAPVTPFAFNGGAGAVSVTMLAFVRRRRLERQRGQV